MLKSRHGSSHTNNVSPQAPDNPNIHFHLGMAYAKTDQPALARQELERVLRINPNYSEAAEVKKQLAQLKS